MSIIKVGVILFPDGQIRYMHPPDVNQCIDCRQDWNKMHPDKAELMGSYSVIDMMKGDYDGLPWHVKY